MGIDRSTDIGVGIHIPMKFAKEWAGKLGFDSWPAEAFETVLYRPPYEGLYHFHAADQMSGSADDDEGFVIFVDRLTTSLDGDTAGVFHTDVAELTDEEKQKLRLFGQEVTGFVPRIEFLVARSIS